MTEREKRNEQLKAKIRAGAEEACGFIDLLEDELKRFENINEKLALELDRVLNGSKAA